MHKLFHDSQRQLVASLSISRCVVTKRILFTLIERSQGARGLTVGPKRSSYSRIFLFIQSLTLATMGNSSHRSCRTEITRQGILLPQDRHITAAVYSKRVPDRCQKLYLLIKVSSVLCLNLTDDFRFDVPAPSHVLLTACTIIISSLFYEPVKFL